MDFRTPGNAALRKGRASIPQTAYLITTTTRERQPFFGDFAIACAASRCFEDERLLGDAQMLAWVLMPDHVHWLIQLGDSPHLGMTVNRLKSASARAANRCLSRTGPLWNSAFHDRAVRQEDEWLPIARYLVANPLRAGLAQRIGDYPFWNARWL